MTLSDKQIAILAEIEKQDFKELLEVANSENITELLKCLKNQLRDYKYIIRRKIKVIDISHVFIPQNVEILREILSHTELMIKLTDFIDYVAETKDLLGLEENE